MYLVSFGSQCQMMVDDHTDFTVEQNSGVGLNVQNIGKCRLLFCALYSKFNYPK